MSRVLRVLLAAALGLAVPAAAGAARTSVFAPVDPGVRAAAMGGAFSAVGGQPTAFYWNPAGLYWMRDNELEASYSSLYSLGIARRTFLSLGFKKAYDVAAFENGEVTFDQDTHTGPAYGLTVSSLFLDAGDPGYSEVGVGGAAAWGYGSHFSLGLSARLLFVNSDIADVSANGYDAGLGIAWAFSDRHRIALSSQHLMSRVFWKFDSTERLPYQWNLGWSLGWTPTILTSLEGEIREGEESPYRLAAGAEWWIVPDRLALRAGYRVVRSGFETLQEPSFGAGGRLGPVQVDYAYRLESDFLGDTHRFGILVDF